MTRKTRFIILFSGMVAFLILAPAIVMYVRGVSFDFETKTFVPTGILSVKTEPKDTQIFLDSKLARSGSGDVRFILPKEYTVEVKKAGYQTWTKHLPVKTGQVSWANPSSNKIYLFLEETKNESLETDVLDFHTIAGKLIYLKPNKIVVTSQADFKNQRAFDLPKTVDKILSYDDSGTNFLLGQSTSSSAFLVFNLAYETIYDISSLFATPAKFQFGSNGKLYALNEESLYQIDAEAKTKKPLLKKIKAFYWLSENLYSISDQSATSSSLQISSAPYLETQTLLTNVPKSEKMELLVSFEKQIFLLSGQTLYLLGSGAEKLAENVSGWTVDAPGSTFSFQHVGQLDYYHLINKNRHFVTRLSQPIANPEIKTAIGWAFYKKGNQLINIELDLRDNQNQYVLYEGKNLQKFIVDSEGKNILVLDDGQLKNLTVR